MMGKSDDISGKIYRALRAELDGAIVMPGSRIRVDRTAERFATSPTPVREALARLSGEHLLVRDQGLGYFAPRLPASAITELLDLSEMLCLAALRRNRGGNEILAAPGDDIPTLFQRLFRKADGPILADMGLNIVVRLAWVRRVETGIIDPASEGATLPASRQFNAREGQTRWLRRYHGLRRRRAAALANAIELARAGAANISRI